MKAIISNAGIRLIGIGNVAGSSPSRAIEGLLDKLDALPQQNGKRLIMLSVDEAVLKYTLPMDQAVRALQEFGVEVEISDAA